MIDRGHEVTLVTPSEAQIAPAAEARGIPTVRLPIARKNAKGLAAMRLWLGRNAHRFDVINTHSSTDTWLVALSRLSIWGAPPIVRTRHVSTRVNNHLPTRWLYQVATRHIVTTGEALRRQLHRDNGYDLARMTSVRTGIDLARFRPMDRPGARASAGIPNQPTLGILATLRDWKGHVQLLEAWNSLRGEFPHWQLLVVGDGPQWDSLHVLAGRLSLGDSIRFVGNQEDAALWLNCMDAFCLPSFGDEGVPQGLMQAMACGVPSVSTPIGAIAEALQDGITGFMTPPRDAVRLAVTLRRLLSDAPLRERLGMASEDFARKNFGIDVMLDAMERVFMDVASKRSRG